MSYEQQRAAESLYRDANSLVYADHKPDDEAVDRVIHKLNMEYADLSPFMVLVLNIPCVFLSLDKTNATSSHESASTKTKAISRTSTSAIVCSTKRYISLTRPFASLLMMCVQIARYYDKYTAEIRASFERGTAL